MENGATFVMIQNATPNTASPIPANTADDTILSVISESFISFPSVVAAVPEVIGPIAARRRAHGFRDLFAIGLAELALRERHGAVAADHEHREHDHRGRDLRAFRAWYGRSVNHY